MLLGRQAGHRLEPVGVVGGALLDGPLLHHGRHDVGDAGVERSALLDRVLDRLEDVLRQAGSHHFFGEDVGSEELANRGLFEVDPGTVRLPAGNRRTSAFTCRRIVHGKAPTKMLTGGVMRGTQTSAGRMAASKLERAGRVAKSSKAVERIGAVPAHGTRSLGAPGPGGESRVLEIVANTI